MKQEFTINRIKLLCICILFLQQLQTGSILRAQTYCYEFDQRVVGTKLEVDIVLTASSPFRLGDTYLNFTYNTAALSLDNPIVFANKLLPLPYSMTVNSTNSGVVSTSVSYNGSVGAGKQITTGGIKVATVTFNILNPLIVTEFNLLNNGFKNVSLSKDDNLTILPLSAQCPPSPYTSLFYDTNIELDVPIPANECIDSTTIGSTKINFGDDETREILPAGFTFTFYCEQVTSLRLGADGALLVNAPVGAVLPNTNHGKLQSLPKVIAPWWDEWRKGMGTVNCLLKDTVISGLPTRMLIIQWNNLSPVDNITSSNLNTDPLKATFNVVIFENSSIIKFNYKDIDFTRDSAGRPDLRPVVEQKQNGVNGSVGIKGECSVGVARDGVNNIIFDGPIGVSLFDVSSARDYKSITFLPISDACVIGQEDIDTIVCLNDAPIQLPINAAAINGTWTGSGTPFLNNLTSQTATFNPTQAGNFELMWNTGCLFDYQVFIQVNPLAEVDAGVDQEVCVGGTVNLNGLIGGSATTGVWNAPSGTFSNANSINTIYTPAITSGKVILTLTSNNAEAPCSEVTDTVVIGIIPNTIPIFNIVSSLCIGSVAPILPTTSENGIAGIWSPTTVSNTTSGLYTFTPTEGSCAATVNINIEVTPKVVPTFSPIAPICRGSVPPILTSISTNGVIGTWSPSVVSNTATGTYIFTPILGSCAVATSITIMVNPSLTPVFNIPTAVCSGGTVPFLPLTSLNGITGTWSPNVISNTTAGTYLFTPTAGVCATQVSVNVTIIFRIDKPIPQIKTDTVFCNINPISCQGRFRDTLRAINPCSENEVLRYFWMLRNAQSNEVLFTNSSPFIDVALDTGCYVIQWVISNSNSNVSDRQTYNVCVRDCSPPEILTHNKNAALTNANFEGEAFVCAIQVLKGLRDNCTDSSTLLNNLTIVRADENPSQQYSNSFSKCIRVTCNDVNVSIPTQVWSIDRAGNANFVLTYIQVQDNIGICSRAVPLTAVQVSTKMETQRPIKNVTVSASLVSTNVLLLNATTGEDGSAIISNLALGKDYQLKGNKTDEPYLGVTTFDIAVINRHILDIERITSPYALLGADVNEDGEIDGTDILIIRNFILQRTSSLPVRAWRFVDSSYVFRNEANPFAEDVPEVIFMSGLTQNVHKAFTAVKKGDVTTVSTPIPPAALIQSRQNKALTIQTEDMRIEKGKNYTIDFIANDFDALSYQFTLGFTEGGAQIESIEPLHDLPNMGDGNFGMFKNSLTTSWNGKAILEKARLFRLHFTALQSGLLSDMLTLNSARTVMEAYNTERLPMSIILTFTDSKSPSKSWALYQNYPNPFEDKTNIAFNLPKASAAQLTFFNAQGQIVYSLSRTYTAGYHEIEVTKQELNASGVFYYRLETAEYSATRKMIVFK